MVELLVDAAAVVVVLENWATEGEGELLVDAAVVEVVENWTTG